MGMSPFGSGVTCGPRMGIGPLASRRGVVGKRMNPFEGRNAAMGPSRFDDDPVATLRARLQEAERYRLWQQRMEAMRMGGFPWTRRTSHGPRQGW